VVARRAHAAFASDRSGVYRIYVMNADGSNLTAVANERTSGRWPAWSPDGRTLAFSELGGDIATVDVAGSGLRFVTKPGKWLDDDTDWSRTANQIAFTWNSTDAASPSYGAWIHVVNPDGTNERSLGRGFDPSWAPDASRLAFAISANATDTDVYSVGAAGGTPTKLTSSGVDTMPAWSPDGAQIAFASDRDSSPGGATDIYVMDADGKNPVRLTTAAGKDSSPAWRSPRRSRSRARAAGPGECAPAWHEGPPRGEPRPEALAPIQSIWRVKSRRLSRSRRSEVASFPPRARSAAPPGRATRATPAP
jgi:Tol biopolymer transport system component